MQPLTILFILLLTMVSNRAFGQGGDSLLQIENCSKKYLQNLDHKIELYSKRISGKTIQTLERLVRLENKVQRLLQQVAPEAASQLFNDGHLSFSALLQKMKDGETVALQYRQQYDQYLDELNTGLKYLEQQKGKLDSGMLNQIHSTRQKMLRLSGEANDNEALQQFIKERKRELIAGSLQHIGRSKYLSRINKEVWYHGETMKNYKAIFSDAGKTERLVKELLQKLPSFQRFMRQNSQLASLFGTSDAEETIANFAGLQTRAGIQGLLQERIAAGGPNAMQEVSRNIQAALAQLHQRKAKLLPSSSGEMNDQPDFKPDMQKTKTFTQRLEIGTNLQSTRSSSYFPVTSDIGLSVGYKLNDRSVIGIGASYKLGWGSGFQHIRFSSEGAGLRSFIDWKLKKNFWLSGGAEANYQTAFSNPNMLYNINSWQKSVLVGLKRKYQVNKKLKGNMQLLLDLLSYQGLPAKQLLVFRVGYDLK